MTPPRHNFAEPALEAAVHKLHADTGSGIPPSIDLSSFQHFDLGPLGDLLALCAAARAGRLNGTQLPPITVLLPTDERARRYLFKLNLFTFATSIGGLFKIATSIDGVHQTDSDLATVERATNSRAFGTPQYPWTPFRQVVKQHDGLGATFEGQCYTLINDAVVTFRESLIQELGYDEQTVTDFWMPNKEIAENIYRHSQSWGYSAIQTTSHGMTIFYGDIGSGIQATLEKHKDSICSTLNRSWSPPTAILAAFTRGITCTPGMSRGDGLDLVKHFVLSRNGRISCRSGDCRVTFLPKGNPLTWAVKYIPGVQLTIHLPSRTKNEHGF